MAGKANAKTLGEHSWRVQEAGEQSGWKRVSAEESSTE